MTDMKASSPLLSIITVCLNASNIERTCETIVNQTFQDFEWIFIDGGSNDEILIILDKYKQRMNYFVSEPDGGIYFGMNKGLAQANGLWLNFMNGGDSFADVDVLQRIFSDAAIDDTCGVLYGNAYHSYNEKRRLGPSKEMVLEKPFFYFHCLPHQAMFYRRNLFEIHGGYDVSFRLLADTEKNINFFVAGEKFKHCDVIVAIYDDNRIRDALFRKTQGLEFEALRMMYFDEFEAQLAQKKYAKRSLEDDRRALCATLRGKHKEFSGYVSLV
jgi:glycosyltransferase involved in cell wall biosynthesis